MNAEQQRAERRALADAADAAADTITAINTRCGNGVDFRWPANQLTDYARNLRIEADEIDDPDPDDDCIHCGALDGAPHHQTCRHGADE